MNRYLSIGAMTGLGLALLISAAAGQEPPRKSTSREQASVGERASGIPPEGSLRRVQRGEPLEPCPQPSRRAGYTAREGRGKGFKVDSCGRRIGDSGDLLPFSVPSAGKRGAASATTAPVTIDRMTTEFSYGSHSAAGPITLVGSADVYHLSDGSQWSSGAGSYYTYGAKLDHVEVSGTTIRYVLAAPDNGLIYQQTDFDSGDHSAQGQLAPAGTLVLMAETGSTTAVLRGNALLVSNDATWYGEPRFNYYSAIVGSVVPFEMTYTLQGSVWSSDIFDKAFNYSVAGFVDFEHPVSTPRAVELSISGPSRIPDEFTTAYSATVRYENGVQRNVSAAAVWTVEPATLASIVGGVLTTGTLATSEALLTLRAEYTEGDTLTATKQVLCLADDPAEKPGSWPMFQANARHTGYVNVPFDPASLTLKWQRNLGGHLALNPVAAGEGKVFVTLLTYFSDVPSLFALGAQDGATLWSKGFGDVFSVNPPSFAYGNVYVQTGNHGSDTWLRAFDGDTGAQIFQAPHEAQWERYFAPTLYEGKAYINGGYYGGMYSFDAYSGAQLWFVGLPQYDEWTPAVDAGRAYAYVGEYNPGLYARNRATGASALFVPDPNFDWSGWSMGLAPVLGDHDDVIVIHDGRLISFDTVSGTIRWEFHSQFAGQPSVVHDRIYAIDAGRLRVLDELTHGELWSWAPDDGDLQGPMIVSDTHVFVSTADRVYAVNLAARQPVWSFPVAGHLAIADNTLYVASADGVLTAFSPPPPVSFYTVTPCRVMDTRLRFGVPNVGPALTSGTPRLVNVASHCGLPLTAKAVSINLTVTEPQSPGHVTLGGAGGASTTVSTINYAPGQTRANNAIIGLDPAGDLTALAVQAQGTTVHLIIDVNGYFQ